MTAVGSCRGAGPLPRDVEQRGKNRRRFHTSPRIRAWGVLNASIGRVHTREAGPRGVSDADRSLLLSRDVHPAYGPRARARSSRARASKTEDRAGPRPTQTSGFPRWLRPVFRGDETRSARTAAGSEARARFGRRGRARRGSDGRTSRRFPGVARSGAGNNETPDRLARWRLDTPDRLHLADESSRQTGAVGGNCELANFYSNRQRPTNRTVCPCPSRICPRGSANGPHPLRNSR